MLLWRNKKIFGASDEYYTLHFINAFLEKSESLTASTEDQQHMFSWSNRKNWVAGNENL